MDERKLRRGLIIVALLGFALGSAATMLNAPQAAQWSWRLGAAPVLVGLSIAIVRDVLAGRMGVDVIAFLSMAAALALGENLAAVIVAIMYAGGNLLEDFAVSRAEHDLKALIDRAPHVAHRRIGDAIEDAAVESVVVGDLILVRAGEVIPIDGQVVKGAALVDEAALTGEPLPVMRAAGAAVSSGTVNAGDAFEMRAGATAGESAYAGIVRMVTAAQAAKAPFMRLADRFALLLTPATLILAGGAWWFWGDPIRALAVLVAATPCPLIIAAPAAFIGGTSLAARRGILLKGGGPLEALARVRTVLFDKTGTLTVGGARLVAIETAPGVAPDEALRLAASLEQASHHVLAATIVAAAHAKHLELGTPENIREEQGSGLEGDVDGKKICVGSLHFAHRDEQLEEWALRAARRASWRSALTVFVTVEGRVIAVMLFADELRRETPRAISALRRVGVTRIVMVTGDRAESAETIGAALDLDAVLAERIPADKVDAVAAEQRRAATLMVGDGINDAPALAAASVGMAMGARGASASSEAADAVLLVDRLDRVPEAIAIARRTRGVALQSIVAGMAMSGAAMIAAALGYVTPVAGALLQEAIDLAVILNALRALSPIRAFEAPPMAEAAADVLREQHESMEKQLERLRQIADALDGVEPSIAAGLILEANEIVGSEIVKHEREDEETIYPRVSRFLSDGHGLSAMSRAHREILHQARLLDRVAGEARSSPAVEPYFIRDAQHIVETVVSLVHIHNAQEEDIYEHAAAQMGRSERQPPSDAPQSGVERAPSAFERALDAAPRRNSRLRVAIGVVIALALIGGGASWVLWRRAASPPGEPPSTGARFAAAAIVGAVNTTPVPSPAAGVVDEFFCDVGAVVQVGQRCATILTGEDAARLIQAKEALKRATLETEAAEAEAARTKAALAQIGEGDARKDKSLRAARAAYHEARKRVPFRRAESERAEAAMKAAQRAPHRREAVSPVAGVVIVRGAVEGETVGGGVPLLLVAETLDRVEIRLRVDAKIVQDWSLGETHDVDVDEAPGVRLQAVVTQLSRPSASTSADAADVVLTAPNPDRRLRPGARVNIHVHREKGVR
jgi:heavy metal translocating P-type ATPase